MGLLASHTVGDLLADGGRRQGFWLAHATQKPSGAVFAVRVVRWPLRERSEYGFELFLARKKQWGQPYCGITAASTVQDLIGMVSDSFNRTAPPGVSYEFERWGLSLSAGAVRCPAGAEDEDSLSPAM